METRVSTLRNGVTVLTGERKESECVTVAVNVSVGSCSEEYPKEWGAAHFLEHMAFKGTDNRNRLQIAREIEGRGGDFNAYTSNTSTLYYVNTSVKHFGHAAELLRDIVPNSTFPEEELEKERNVILEEISMRRDNAYSTIWEEFDARLFGGTTRAHPICGTEESVSKLNREELLLFRNRTYGGKNIQVAAVGKLESDAIKYLEDLWSDVELEIGAGTYPIPATLGKKQTSEVESKFEQCYLFLGRDGVRNSEYLDNPEAEVTSTLLGTGMSSILFQRIREELGLAYAVGSVLDVNTRNGSAFSFAVLDKENADRAAEEMEKALREVADGKFKREAFQEAVERCVGPVLRSETNNVLLGRLLSTHSGTGAYLSPSDWEKRLRSVTNLGIAEFAQLLLSRHSLQVRLLPKS